MSTAAVRGVVRQLGLDPPTDAALLTRYARHRDDDAFAELLRRHGPVVLGVCRRTLTDPHAADDAFQAVFLVLARKAGSVRPPGRVGGWLYGVAVRTAKKAKVAAARRWRREMASAEASRERERPEDSSESLDRAELRAVIDDELGKLPAALREAVVLCDLGGKTRAEAARELGWPEGTVAARLAKARKLLADRLTRRGVALTAAGLAAALTPAVAPALAQTTLAAAGAFGRGLASPVVSPTAQALAEGVLRAMTTGKMKLAAVLILAGGLLAGTTSFGGPPARGPAAPPPGRAAAVPNADAKPDPKPERERNQDLWAWQERPRPYPGNAGSITWADGVTFRPDGKAFAAIGGDGTGCEMHLFDTAKLDGVPSAGQLGSGPPIIGGTPRTIQALGISYAADGKPPAAPIGLAFSPDGRFVAVPQPGQIDVRDVASRWINRVVLQKDARPTAVAFGPVGEVAGKPHYKIAYTDGRAAWATSWVGDAASGTAQFGPLTDAPKLDGLPHVGVAYSPDGKRLVFIPNMKIDPKWPDGDGDPAKKTHWYAMVWGGGSGEAMGFLKHGTDPVTAVAWAPDGRIATADTTGVVVVWDGTTLKERKRVKLSGPVTALAFREDGKRFAAGVLVPERPGEAGAVRVEVVSEWEGSSPDNWMTSSTLGLSVAETVRSLAFSPDGLTLVAGTATADGKGGGLRVWDRVKLAPRPDEPAAVGGWQVKAVVQAAGEPVHSAAFDPAGKLLAVGRADGSVQAWDAATLRPAWNGKIGPAGFTAVAFDPEGEYFVATSANALGFYHPVTGKPMGKNSPTSHGGPAVAFAPQGRWVAVSDGYSTEVRSLVERGGAFGTTGAKDAEPLRGKLPAALAWAPSGRRVAYLHPTGRDTRLVMIAGVGPKDGTGTLDGHDGQATAVAWSADGRRIVTGGADGQVIACDADTLREVWRAKIAGRNGGSTVHTLAISPDGATVAAGVELDAGKGVHRVVTIDAATGKEAEHLTRDIGATVNGVAFSPDGRRLAVACGDRPGTRPAGDKAAGGVVVYERAAR